MAFIAPQPPDALLKLLKNQAATPGQPGVVPPPGVAPPGVFGAPGATMPSTSGGIVAGAGAPAVPQAQPVKAPAPSDDPAVSDMGTIPKVPDFSSFITAGIQRRQAAEDKLNALHSPTPEEYKPSIWRRLLSVPLATAAGLGNPQAGATASDEILHGGFNRAQAQYRSQAAPIEKELENTKADFPMYTAAGEAANRQFEAGISAHREQRETETAKSNADYKAELNSIRATYDQGRIDAANKSIDERLRALDEAAERNKNNAEIQDRLATAREELVKLRAEHEEKGKDKSTQFRTVATQKATAISKANAKHDKAVSELAPNDVQGHKEAQDELQRDLQDAQDAYEEGITTLGGSAEHQEVTASGWKKSRTQPESQVDIPQPVISPATDQRVQDNVGGTPVTRVGVSKDQLNAATVPPKPSPSKPAKGGPKTWNDVADASKLVDGHGLIADGKRVATAKGGQWIDDKTGKPYKP